MKQILLSLLSTKEYKKKLAMAVFFLFFFLFILQIYLFFKPVPSSMQEKNIKDAFPKEEVVTAQSPLFKSALFGEYVPVNLSDKDIKQSRLNLEIVGIMYSPQEKNSQVLIRAAGEEEHAYVIGDTLPGGAIIKRIRQQGILVLHNGALESLSLPKNDLRFEDKPKPLFRE